MHPSSARVPPDSERSRESMGSIEIAFGRSENLSKGAPEVAEMAT